MVASNLRLYILAGIYSEVEDSQHEDGRDQVLGGPMCLRGEETIERTDFERPPRMARS